MAALSDPHLASLIEECALAMRESLPIADSLARVGDRRMGKTGKVAAELAQQLRHGQSLTESLRQHEDKFSTATIAAAEAAEMSGDWRILNRYASQLRRRSELHRQRGFAIFYPMLLLLIGYVFGATVFAPFVLSVPPSDIDFSPWIVSAARWITTYWFVPLVLILASWLFLCLWARFTQPVSWAGRRGLFCDTLADQIEHDVNESSAIRTAAAFADIDQLSGRSDLCLESSEVQYLLGHSIPNQSVVPFLRATAADDFARASWWQSLWTRHLPRIGIVLFGGGMTLFYAWFVIRPVYTQIGSW